VSFPGSPALIARGLPEKFIDRGKGTSITAVCGGMLSASQITAKLKGTSMLPATASNVKLRVVPCPPAKFPYGIGMMTLGRKAITFGFAAVTLVTLVIRRLTAVTRLLLTRPTSINCRKLAP